MADYLPLLRSRKDNRYSRGRAGSSLKSSFQTNVLFVDDQRLLERILQIAVLRWDGYFLVLSEHIRC